MKLGLFGGSFDPIHNGHVAPVRSARKALGLDKVLFLPTAVPPHKPGKVRAPALARYAMVELALLDEEGLEVSPHELTLGRPAYTVETLEHFHAENRGAELHLLLGEDSFLDLGNWVRFPDIVRAARLVVMARPGWSHESAALPAELRQAIAEERVSFVGIEAVDLSSTRIRALLREGGPLPLGAVPELVLRYLAKYPLYR